MLITVYNIIIGSKKIKKPMVEVFVVFSSVAQQGLLWNNTETQLNIRHKHWHFICMHNRKYNNDDTGNNNKS